MSREKQNPENNKPTKEKLSVAVSRKLRLALKILAIFIGVLVILFIILHIILNRYSDRILQNTVKEIVNVESGGLYRFDFKESSVNLFARRLKIDSLRFYPDKEFIDNDTTGELRKKKIISLSIPVFELDLAKIISILRKRELIVTKLLFDNPDFKIYLPEVSSDTSHKKLFDHTKAHSYFEDYLTVLKIDELDLKNGSIEIISPDGDTVKRMLIDNISIYLNNFHLDSVAHKRIDKFFFSDSISISIEGGRFDIVSKNYELTFDTIDIFTSEKKILLKGFKFNESDFTSPESDKAIIDLYIPEIQFKEIDILKFLNREVFIGEIKFIKPEIFFKPSAKKKKQKFNYKEFCEKLFGQISKTVESVQIKKIDIQQGNLKISDVNNNPSYNISDLNLTLLNFLLDSSDYKKRSGLLFLDDLVLELGKQELSVHNSGHLLKFDRLKLDTRSSEFVIDNLSVSPEKTNLKEKTKIKFSTPSFIIKGIDFKKDLVERKIRLKEIRIFKTDIDLEIFPGDVHKKSKFNIKDLPSAIPEFLHDLSVKNFFIDIVSLNVDKGKGVFKNQIYCEQTNLVLSDFLLDPESANDENRFLYSAGINLEVSKFSLKLPDSLHILSFKNVSVNSDDSTFSISGFSLDTPGYSFNKFPIDKNIINAEFDKISATGLNFSKLYHDNSIFIDNFLIENPGCNFYRNIRQQRKKIKKDRHSKKIFSGELLIKNLILKDGCFGYFIQGHSVDNATQLKGLNFQALNFRFDDEVHENIFDADTFLLKIAEIKGVLDDSLHSFKLENLITSVADSSILIENIIINPKEFSAIKKEGGFTLNLPKVALTGIPVKYFLKKKKLKVEEFSFDQPHVKIILAPGKKQHKKIKIDENKIKTNVCKILRSLEIEKLNVNNASIDFFSSTTFNSKLFSIPLLNIEIDNFFIDSLTKMQEDNFLFSEDINVKAKNISSISKAKKQSLLLGNFELSSKDKLLSVENLTFKNGDGRLNFPGAEPENSFDLNLNRFAFEGLDFFSLFVDNKFFTEKIIINKPTTNVKSYNPGKDKKKPSSEKFDLYKKLSKHLFSVNVNEISIVGASINYEQHKNGSWKKYLVDDAGLDMKNFRIDSASRIFENNFLYAGDCNLNIGSYSLVSSDSLYDFGLTGFNFTSIDSFLVIDSVYLTPKLNEKDFAKKVGYQTDCFNFFMKNIKAENIHFHELYYDRKFWLDKLVIDTIMANDYRDKRYPMPPHHFPKLPATALHNLPFILQLDTFCVENGFMQYHEHVEPALQAGKIWFENINIEGRNITNDPEMIRKNKYLEFSAGSEILGKGRVDIFVKFDLTSEVDSFLLTGYLNQMDLTSFNDFIEHVAFIKVKKGINNKLQFRFAANNDFSKGEMDFRYKNLKVRLVDKISLKDGGIGESIASFIANTFIVRTNNPKHLMFKRDGEIFFERDKHKSFFNYFAKSVLSGVKSTVRGGNEEKQEKRKKRRLKKQLEKESKNKGN